MELLRENIRARQTLGTSADQVLVEGSIDLPEDSADVTRVILADARILTGGIEPATNRVSLTGSAMFTIVVQADDGQMYSYIWESDFTHAVEVQGCTPKMQASVSPTVEQVNARASTPRRIEVSAVVNLAVTVTFDTEASAITGVEDLDGVQTQTVNAELPRTTGEGSEQLLVQEMAELPAGEPSALRALWWDPCIKITNIVAEAERVNLTGQLVVKVLYATGDAEDPLAQTILTLPLEASVAVSGAMSGDNVQCDITVMDISIRVEQDENGQGRGFLLEATLLCQAHTWSMETVQLLVDAYAPGHQLTATYGDVKVELPEEIRTVPVSAKGEWLLPGGAPGMGRVLALTLRPAVSSSDRREDGITNVEGILAGDVAYMNPDEPAQVFGFEGQTPLALELADVPANAKVSLGVDYANAMLLSSDTVEARYGVTATVRSTPASTLHILTDLTDEGAAEAEAPGVVLYFAQPGDTYWSIAKSLGTTVESMRRYNPHMGDEATAGERLVLLT